MLDPRSVLFPFGKSGKGIMAYFECHTVDLSFYETASERFVFEVDLDCTPDRLFAIFEDPIAWTIWAPGLKRVEWTSPKPFGIGTTRTVDLRGGPQVFEEFIAWERGKLMAFCFLGATEKVWWSFGERYEVTDLGNGRCRLKWTVAYDPRGGFARAHPFIRPLMRLTLRTFMSRLQRYAREHAAASADSVMGSKAATPSRSNHRSAAP